MPDSHGVQLSTPIVGLKLPAAQLAHEFELDAENVPGLQKLHMLACASLQSGWVLEELVAPQHENWPKGTAVQLVVKRSAGIWDGHPLHLRNPEPALYWPASQLL